MIILLPRSEPKPGSVCLWQGLKEVGCALSPGILSACLARAVVATWWRGEGVGIGVGVDGHGDGDDDADSGVAAGR